MEEESMKKEKWGSLGLRVMVFLTILTVFMIPGLCNAAQENASHEGMPPIPPELAEQYDSDGDGELSDDERDAAREAFMEEFDTDGDGELSREERHAVREALHDAFIERYDTDGDGELSQEERETARADFVERFDADGDGELSEDERQAARPRGFGHSGKGLHGKRSQ